MEIERSTIRILNSLTSVSLAEFDDRLQLQKLVYLARKLGYDLGYTFSWYHRGPYSPSLTRMLFSANEQGHLELDEYDLSASERDIVDHLREFLHEDIEEPRILELLASVWYFLKSRRYDSEAKNVLLEEIHQKKPQYSRDEIEEAFERIQHFRGI